MNPVMFFLYNTYHVPNLYLKISYSEATYPDALADFHHDVALRGGLVVHGTSNNEHNYTRYQYY